MRTTVVGAGAAGLWCALHAAERGEVTIVAPDPAVGSATALAQGGIAAAVAEGDDPEAHAADTIAAGAGLCDERAVRVLTEEGPAAIRDLRRRGMSFDEGGEPTREGGHTAPRVLHAGGDATGRVLLGTLLGAARADRRIGWRAGRVTDVLPGKASIAVRVAGEDLEADRVVLAAGGATGIYGRRTGPDRSVGAGIALAWEAGATVADLEFVQFHPTALAVPGRPPRLLTEALRGEGAVLLDARGRRFMERFHPLGELAPRDVVARAIHEVRERTGAVTLDATGIPHLRRRFPTAAATCDEVGLDPTRDPIPVAPAAHYFVGGVLTDLHARTTVPRLFACGETASTGVHGANRLASNSLLEALVFGRRAAAANEAPGPVLEPSGPLELPEGPGPDLEGVRAVADRHLGVVRTADGMAEARRSLGSRGGGPAALVGRLLAAAAERREESRGAHFRTDHPEPRPAWRRRQALSHEGWAALSPTP